jgi:sugar lactone lactonase YvrE
MPCCVLLLAACAGNLYVTRVDDSKIVMLSPTGATLKTFQLPFSVVSNLELGGKDGKTLVAVGGCGPGPRHKTKQDPTQGCVRTLRVDTAPGRAWQMLQDGLPKNKD